MKMWITSLYRVFFLLSALCLANAADALAVTSYEVDFKLTSSTSYGAIDVRVDYSIASSFVGGGFQGVGSGVSCTPNATLNAVMAFNDDDPLLKTGMIRLQEIQGPTVLFTCIYDSDAGAPEAWQFVIWVSDWGSETTSTAPTVTVSRIEQGS